MHISSNVWYLLGARGSNTPPPQFVTWLFFAMATVAGIVALVSYWQVRRRLANAKYSEGVVIRLIHTFARGGQLYAPVFRFTSCAGTNYTVESSVFEYPPKFQVGDTIRVVYQEPHPENAEYVGRFAQWGVVLVSGALAVWASLFAVLFLCLL